MSNTETPTPKKKGFLSGLFSWLSSTPSRKTLTSYRFDKKQMRPLCGRKHKSSPDEVPANTTTWFEARKVKGTDDLYKVLQIMKATPAVRISEYQYVANTTEAQTIDGKKALSYVEAVAALQEFDQSALNSDTFDEISTKQKYNTKYHWSRHVGEDTKTSSPQECQGMSSLKRLQKRTPK